MYPRIFSAERNRAWTRTNNSLMATEEFELVSQGEKDIRRPFKKKRLQNKQVDRSVFNIKS